MFVNFSFIFCRKKSALSVDRPFFSVAVDLRSLSLAPTIMAAVISALSGNLGVSVACFVFLISIFFSEVAIPTGGGGGGAGTGGGGGGGAGTSNEEGKSDGKLLSVINCLVYGSMSGGGGMGGACGCGCSCRLTTSEAISSVLMEGINGS